jgi:hypothetical protein
MDKDHSLCKAVVVELERSLVGSIEGSALIWKSSLRTFAALCVLCGKKTLKTINRKERQERKVYAKT